MTTDNTTIINRLSFILVGVVGVGAFVLSYASLWGTALAFGLSPRLAWIWPLLVDFALIVFSLSVVRASLKGERVLWPWLLVGLYTVGTVAFNVLHAPDNLTARIVAIVAPVSLFLSFETLMAMLKAEVRRGSLVLSLGQVSANLSQLEAEYQEKRNKLESELGELERAMLEGIGQLEGQRASLQEELETKAKTLTSYTQDIEAKKEELKRLGSGSIKVYLPANLSITQRRELVNLMAKDGLTAEAISEALGVSIGTVKNDKQAAKEASLNGNGKV